MRNVKYAVANSLDGFIARQDDSFDWIIMDGEVMNELTEFFKSVDTVLMGRRTYEVVLSHATEETYPANMKSYVFSRTLKKSENAEIISENAAEFIRQLKHQDGKDIWLMGGANLAKTLFDENLVDEILLGVHPILLGSGIPLFPQIKHEVNLELTACKRHQNGTLSLFYKVRHRNI